MTHERRAEIDSLFSACLDLPAGERITLLARVAADDRELAAAVRDLLAAAGRSDSPLDAGPPGLSRLALESALHEAHVDPRLGERVGPYRLLEEIGRGGMSVVYLAERADPSFDQRVAIKLLALTTPDPMAMRRFEQERQILAALNHPNIARLVDGGADETGRPYIVMEYVRGRDLEAFCRQRALGIAQRLELVEVIGAAVEYAHRNLVIHRDLKPSNILVSDDGEVKLLDFGIARLLEQTSSGDLAAPPTRATAPVLTPEYASPEQIRGERVTTASDVYQLGVVLYELLTGSRPLHVPHATAAEVRRAVCEQNVQPPSAVVPQPEAARQLRGDLDLLVLKALEKDPEHRYGTVRELLEDLTRFRHGLPIRARKSTLAYRAGRFVRRHRVGVAAGALLVLTLAAGLAGTTWQAVVAAGERNKAREEARRAEVARSDAVAAALRAAKLQRVLVDLVFETNPWHGGRHRPDGARLVEQAIVRVEQELAGDAAIQAEMFDTLFDIVRRMADHGRAGALAARTLTLRLALHGPFHESVADSIHDMGAVEWSERRYSEAGALFTLALARYRQACGGECPRVVSLLSYLGTVHYYQGRFAEAEAILRQALALRRQVMGPDHETVAISLNNLALVLAATDRLAEAEALQREALALRRRLLGEHISTAQSQLNLAAVLLRWGGESRLAEAEALAVEGVSLREELLAPGHPLTVSGLQRLAAVLRARGKVAEAAAYQRSADELQRGRQRVPAFNDGREYARLARLFQEHRDDDAAQVFSQVARRHAEGQLTSEDDTPLTDICRALGTLLDGCGR
jgi:eukaryotic-like serine/threonine-protein kinase